MLAVCKPVLTLVIPTRNARPHLHALIPSLQAQRPPPDEILILDSGSRDGTQELFYSMGARVVGVDPDTFSHGGIRRLATRLVKADVYVFLTQDAIPAASDSVARLAQSLYHNGDTALAYGRQIPKPDAGPLGAHARLFNYPSTGRTKRLADVPELGLKTCFASNSFAAYRGDALQSVGSFPDHVVAAEDVYVAARLLLAGWAIRYEASACVYHSHDYPVVDEFRRYFDIGVFYGREKWITEHFGQGTREGIRFIRSEVRYLAERGHWGLMPAMAARAVTKYLGYRLGHAERLLPHAAKRRLSACPSFWSAQAG